MDDVVELDTAKPSDSSEVRLNENLEKHATTNFTSTPFLEEAKIERLLFPFQPGQEQEAESSANAFVEKISQIAPPLSAQPLPVCPTNITSCVSRSTSAFGDSPRESPISYLSEGAASTNLTTHTIGEIVPWQRGLALTCHKVKLQRNVNVGFWKNIQNCRRSGAIASRAKTILHDINAYFAPGLNAVMGPSGCGKTSLLSALSLRDTSFTGTIRLNGNPAPSHFAQLCGYSIQDDILNPGLTVIEHLWFSLCLRRGAVLTKQEKNTLLKDIVKNLKLEGCCDKKIGVTSDSLISGGERKRTGIGMELVAAPKILFLDEPTSGLDSSMSKNIIHILKKFAINGRTVILSIHQPSSRIYRGFDNLSLLAKGRLVYQGSASRALNYFTSLGIPHEPHYSPPDFFIDILFGKVSSNRRRKSTKHTPHPRRVNSVKQAEFTPTYWTTVADENAGDCRRELQQRFFSNSVRGRPIVPVITLTRDSQASNSANNNVRIFSPEEMSISEEQCFSPTLDVDYEGYASKLDGTTCEGMKEHSDVAQWLEDEYNNSPLGHELNNRLHELQNRSVITDELHMQITSREESKQLSFGAEVALLTRRTMKGSARVCLMLLIMNSAIGLLFGTLYYNNSAKGKPLTQNRLGMLFYLSVHGILVPSMITAKNFVETEKALFEHEKRSGYYRALSYCSSRFATIVLARMLSSAALSAIVYWMTGLNPERIFFLRFLLTALASGLACDSLCLLCALASSSFAFGKSVVIMYMSLTSVFAGFMVNLDSTFPWLSWIKYISITRYCYVSWIVGEFSSACAAEASTDWLKLSGTPQFDEIGNAKECGELVRAALVEIVGGDQFMIEHWWINHVVLAAMTTTCLFFCYIKMQKIK